MWVRAAITSAAMQISAEATTHGQFHVNDEPGAAGPILPTSEVLQPGRERNVL